MRFSATSLFPLFLLSVLALLSLWLKHTTLEQTPEIPVIRHDPDYIVHDFTVTRYNSQGIAESRLSAAKMIHYPDDDWTQFIAPHLVQSRPDQPRMTVTAKRGAISQVSNEVFLYGNVRVVRAATRGQPGASMATSFLHIARNGTLFLSDREVTIHEGDRVLSGRGMKYNNATGELVLRHQVRSRIEPNPSG